jgi:hypothetical protein
MSNYYSRAKRPGGDSFEDVEMNDDAYGKHKYGVIFPDGKQYPVEECDFGIREIEKETMTNEELEKLVMSLEERISKLEDDVCELKFPLK